MTALRYWFIGCVFSMLLFGCSEDYNPFEDFDCSAVSCIGPPVLFFDVIQNDSNVFLSQAYQLEDISINGNSADNFNLSINDQNLNSIPRLLLQNDNWQTGTLAFNLNFADDFSFEISLEIGLSTGDCCGGIPILENIEINGVPQNLSQLYMLTLD